jgi:hypothetical protein
VSSIYDFDENSRERSNYKYYVKIFPKWKIEFENILINDAKYYGRLQLSPNVSFIFHIYKMPNKKVELTFYREIEFGKGGTDAFFSFNVYDAAEIFPELENIELGISIGSAWHEVG